ncbi:histidine kinase [Hyphobacterium sp. WM6]|uniref:Histidine kinase n=2 Tax=Hyphobacterium vulgare TaxID=1736751 RepID=A0ABV6ZYB8_9PROT
MRGRRFFAAALHALTGPLLVLIMLAVISPNASAVVIQGDPAPHSVWRAGEPAPWASDTSRSGQWLPIETLDPNFRGAFWMQVPVSPDQSWAGVQAVVRIKTNLTIDAYWDGRFLGNNSALPVGSTPRPYQTVELTLPSDWTQTGLATLSIYARSEGLPQREELFVEFDIRPSFGHVQAVRVSDWIDGAAIFLSFFIAISFGVLWALRRHRPDLLLAAVTCLSVSAIILLDYDGRAFYLISSRSSLADAALFVLSLAVLMLIPALFAVRLKINNRLVWSGVAIAAVFMGMPSWPILTFDQDARIFLAMTAVLLAMAATAPQRQLEKLGFAAGSLALAVVIVLEPDNLTRFLAALTFLMSIWLLVDLFLTESNARRAEAKSARLQTELIKRNIQPHFILNSLTVAIELQETDRQMARRFIEALAEEYRALSDLIDKPSVTLLQELNLTRKHLAMMSFRMGRTFSLKYTGDSPEQAFPPGILHTLVENALSHNRYQDPAVEFAVSVETSRGRSRLTLRIPLGTDQNRSGASSGSGMAYVKARLEDFAPGAWSLSSVQEGSHWVTSVTFKVD